jgi:hypothetical protein
MLFPLRHGIIHAPLATLLPSAKFARIQAAPYRGLEGHLNEESTAIASILDEPCSTQTTRHKEEITNEELAQFEGMATDAGEFAP